MKVRGIFFLSLFVLASVLYAPPAAAGSLKDLFTAATQSNQDYSIYKIDLELAQLKKNMAKSRPR